MADPLFRAELPGEDHTHTLAKQIAARLTVGDTLLLSGPVGAGKSAFARALIRQRLGNPEEEVPSPSFTLVQTYPHATGDLWHCDLYRLSHPDELFELGLEAAFDTAICLIEWPDRLGDAAPPDALHLTFGANAQSHDVTVTGPEAWALRLEDLHG